MTLLSKLEKLLDKTIGKWYNKTCWRCGSTFYHGFAELCSKCTKEIKK